MANEKHRQSWICETSLRAAAVAAMMTVAFAFAGLAQSVQAQSYSLLHTFTGGQDGSEPSAGLSVDASGNNFYGTASVGGSHHCGTVFKLSRRGSGWLFSPLYEFESIPDGCGPSARVVIGSDGALYGTTYQGGTSGQCRTLGCGTVFKLQPPASFCHAISCFWTETVLYRFSGGSDGSNPTFGDLAFDQGGNLYGTATYGANQNCNAGCGVVFKLTPAGGTWTYSIAYTFTGQADGGQPSSGVTFDSFGDLYGTTTYGYGNVYELLVSSNGFIQNTLYSFTGHDDGYSPIGGLIFDRLGTLYGTAWLGGSGGGGTVYSLTPSLGNWTFNVLHSFSGADGATGPFARLAMDNAGNLYGTTVGAHNGPYGTVFELTFSNGNWIESDLHDFMGDSDGANPNGSVLVDNANNLYGVAEYGGTGDGVAFEISH